jgi:PST family polysaccharide transporter
MVVGRARRLVGQLFTSGGTLGQRSARGGLWAFASYGGVRVLTLVRSIILARLLLPADFGLVNMALVAVGFLAVWTEVGMAPALIYKQDSRSEVLDTAWLISAARGILLCAVTFACAGLIAAFFRAPDLAPIVRAMSFTFLGYGLTSIGMVLLKRELEFRRLAYVELGSEIVSLVIGVIAAVILRNAWALVLALLSKVLTA